MPTLLIFHEVDGGRSAGSHRGNQQTSSQLSWRATAGSTPRRLTRESVSIRFGGLTFGSGTTR
jgi:hypothetical protein